MMEDPDDKDLVPSSVHFSCTTWMQQEGEAYDTRISQKAEQKPRPDDAQGLIDREKGLLKQVFVWKDWMQGVKICRSWRLTQKLQNQVLDRGNYWFSGLFIRFWSIWVSL